LNERIAPNARLALAVFMLLLVAAVAVASLLSQGSEAEAQLRTPDYEVLEETAGTSVREVVVQTEARREEGLRLITEDLVEERPPSEDGVLLVEFRDEARVGEDSGRFGLRETGFAVAFDSEEAALADDLPYEEEEAQEIFEEEDGIRAVSFADFGDDNPDLADDLEGALR